MSTHFNPQPQPEGSKGGGWRQKKWLIPVAAAFTVLLIGVAIGQSGKPREAPAPVIESPVPAPTVTKMVEKTVEVTPPSCLKALDLSEQGFSYTAEAMGYMADALKAAGDLNVPAMQKANADMAAVSPKLKALTTPMRAASTDCRAAAK